MIATREINNDTTLIFNMYFQLNIYYSHISIILCNMFINIVNIVYYLIWFNIFLFLIY